MLGGVGEVATLETDGVVGGFPAATPGEWLINRRRELAHINHLLHGARHGSNGTMALRGVAGMGKTSLISAAIGMAPDFGVVQLRGTHGIALPPREWPQPLAELFARWEMEVDRPLVPASGLRPDTDALVEGPPPVVHAAARALERVANFARPPLLVVVDDCHLIPRWFPAALAGAVTSGLLHDLPVALILAWRDTPHVAPFVLGIREVPEYGLDALGVDDAAELFEQRELQVPDRAVLKHLVSATAGVPHALMDAHSHLTREQLDGSRPLPTPVPMGEGLAQAFGASVTTLSEPARTVAAAAALGAPLGTLEAALHQLGEDPSALRELEDPGIITVRNRRVDFHHPLVSAAAFALRPPEVRDAIQLALADAFEAEGNLERSAHHTSQGHRAPSGVVAQRYANAARTVLTHGEAHRAASCEEMAAAYAESNDTAASHLTRAAALWTTMGNDERALASLTRADALSVSDHLRAEVLYHRARVAFAQGADGELPTGSATLEMVRAADLCQSSAPQRAVLMLVNAAGCLLFRRSAEGAASLAERALELARGVSSHMEALAGATLRAADCLEGRPVGRSGRGGQPAELLLGQGHVFVASPHVAHVIGEQLMTEGQWELAARWAGWIAQCAARVGDRPLSAVAPSLQATVALAAGRMAEARRAAEEAVAVGDGQIAARALATLSMVHATLGQSQPGFQYTSRLFGLPGDVGRLPRLQAQYAMATLELQRQRVPAALAWLHAALNEALPVHGPPVPGAPGADRPDGQRPDPTSAHWITHIAELLVLCDRGDEASGVMELMGAGPPEDPCTELWSTWLAGLCSPDMDVAASNLRRLRGAQRGAPILETNLVLVLGARLVDAGQDEAARPLLEEARHRFRSAGADGGARLADNELAQLATSELGVTRSAPEHRPAEAGDAAGAPGGGDPAPSRVAEADPPPAPPAVDLDEPAPPWQIDLLGGLTVRRDGEPVHLPHSLASHALMIVALKRRVGVDELVELLWPGAEPGVGNRRLRNVLWRIRSGAGELLERDGNFIRLADQVVIDVEFFRRSADEALVRTTSPTESVAAARRALRLYKGELLPGVRYADWTANARESLARQQAQLLELLLEEALGAGHLQDAFGYLDQLIDVDPYNERHHLELAKLYAGVGHRQRALRVLEQAERVMDELDLSPSKELLAIRRSLKGVGDDGSEQLVLAGAAPGARPG